MDYLKVRNSCDIHFLRQMFFLFLYLLSLLLQALHTNTREMNRKSSISHILIQDQLLNYVHKHNENFVFIPLH